MSVGGRAQTRERFQRRAWLIEGALPILAHPVAVHRHWVLGLIFAAGAAVALWVVLQTRTVR